MSDEEEKAKEPDLFQELIDEGRLVVNDDGTKTLTLTEPVVYQGMTKTEITFRRPRGKDWRMTDEEKGEVGKSFRLAAAVSGLSMKVFDEMDGADALACASVASNMGKKSPTGGTS